MSITSSYIAAVSGNVKTGATNMPEQRGYSVLGDTKRKSQRHVEPSLGVKGCQTNTEKTDAMKTRGGKNKGSSRESPGGSEVKEKRRRQVQKVALADVNGILPLPIRNEGSGEGFPKFGPERVGDDFYDVPCEQLAKALLGCVLVRRLTDGQLLKGRIVETECYLGGEDKASHSCGGRVTERNRPMYMKPGTTYVYFTYGMYHCFNISSQGPGAAVLLRAIDPLEGMERMLQERAKKQKTTKPKPFRPHELCNGPGKLCLSFCLDKVTCNAQDLCQWGGMWVERSEPAQSFHIVTSTRIGIDSVGGEWVKKPLRFYILGNPSVSRRDKAKERELQDSLCSSYVSPF